MKLRSIKRVNLDFFKTANFRVVETIDIQCSAAQIMKAIHGKEIWSEWVSSMKDVDWTCDKPYGQGSTRTITLTAGFIAKEIFFHWQEGHRVSFCIVDTNIPWVESWAEDFQIETLDNNVSRFKWTLAIEPEGVFKYFSPILKFFTGFFLQHWLRRFKRLLESS